MAKKTDDASKKKRKAASSGKPAAPRRRTRMIALEPRMLFDGALGADLSAAATAAMQGDKAVAPETGTVAASEPAAPRTEAERVVDARGEPAALKEIVFIDSSVPDAEALALGARDGVTVVRLDPARNAIEQITERLGAEKNVDAVHIVSHGGQGFIKLGGEVLNAETLVRYADQLAAWRDALAADADLLIYGCAVARDGAGEAFVNRLSELTQADVAASKDATGAERMGGDWTF